MNYNELSDVDLEKEYDKASKWRNEKEIQVFKTIQDIRRRRVERKEVERMKEEKEMKEIEEYTSIIAMWKSKGVVEKESERMKRFALNDKVIHTVVYPTPITKLLEQMKKVNETYFKEEI